MTKEFEVDSSQFNSIAHKDSAIFLLWHGRLYSRTIKHDEVDSTYFYSIKGRLTKTSWNEEKRLFLSTESGYPAIASPYFFKRYNKKGTVIRLYNFDMDHDAFIDIIYYKNGQPRRIIKWFRDKEECSWYNRNGTVRRTKSCVKQRDINPIDLDFDIKTLY